MRRVVVAILIALILAPFAASAEKNSGRCRRLTKQIHQTEGMVKYAESVHNVAWAVTNQAHVDRLDKYRARLCPGDYDKSIVRRKAEKFAKEMDKLIKTAARAAVQYFTMGAF